MKVVNINWLIDEEKLIDTIRELIDNHSDSYIAELLEIDIHDLPKTDSKMMDYLLDRIHHRPALENKLFNLPNEVELPEELIDEEDGVIADWLSCEFGYCHEGFFYENEL